MKTNSPRQQVPTREDLTPPQGNSDVVVISPFDGASPNSQRQGNSPQHTIAAGGSSEVAINQPRPLIFRKSCKRARKIMERNSFPSGRTSRASITATPPAPQTTPRRRAAVNTPPKLATPSARWPAASWAATPRPIATRSSPPIRQLQKNINNVVVGHAYVIPQSAGAPVATPAVVAQKPQPQTPAAPVNQPAQSPTHWYTVKENDSLWRIAQEQLGDGNAVAAIKELNKDVLKGGDAIRPNMRLRMPAKPLASAS